MFHLGKKINYRKIITNDVSRSRNLDKNLTKNCNETTKAAAFLTDVAIMDMNNVHDKNKL